MENSSEIQSKQQNTFLQFITPTFELSRKNSALYLVQQNKARTPPRLSGGPA